MESPLEERGATASSTSRHEKSETGSGELSYAEVATPASRNEESETPSNEGRMPLSISRNVGSDTDSSEEDKGNLAHIYTSRNEESSTDSGDHNEARSLPTRILRNEESETDSDESSSGDVEIEQGHAVHNEDSSSDSSAEFLDEKTPVEEEEGERDGNAYIQEEQGSPKASADERFEPSSSFDWVVEESIEISPKIAESYAQILGDNVGSCSSTSEEESERDKNISLQSPHAPTDEESKSNSSQAEVVRDIGPELVEFDEHGLDDPTEVEDDYIKKGFTCDGNTEEEDEQLREYWTRALQTSTSTGQVVEEIVKVLKHHQKTHDLLCPVCGSCVTRRVILRKRKRSSLMSVDRWYRDPLDEGGVQEQGSSLEVMEAVEEEDSQDTKAFGCLACFSLFFEKGYLLLNQLQADIGSDTFNCLPFFFPPYPWGMTQMKPRSPGLDDEVPNLEEIEESMEPSSTNVRSSFTCDIGSTLLPDYPWGTMPLLLKGFHGEGPSLQEVEEAAVLDVQESLTADVESVTCGIGSTLLPDYPWGTMPCLSKGDVIQPSNQTDTAIGVISSGQDVEQACDVPQSEDIEESSQLLIKERTCTCGLAPALLPAYPWGYCAKGEEEQLQGLEDAVSLSHSVERPKPSINESTCACGLAPALIPNYPWGYLSKVEEVALQSPSDLEAGLQGSTSTVVEDTNMQGVSQPESSEEPPQLCREGRNCTCGLVPALLPDYPWGFFAKDEGADTGVARVEPQAKPVEETEGKTAEDIGPSRDLVSTVLPDYPWGITTESEEPLPILREKSDSRRDMLSFGTNVRVGSAVLPSYPWGICSVNQSVHEQNGSAQAQVHQEPADRDCTCGLGLTMLPKFLWGPTRSTVDKQDQTERQQVKYYAEQETKQETRITSTTDLFIVTTSESTHPGLRPPQNIKTKIAQHATQTVQHVKLDQTVTIINAAPKVDEVPDIKGSPLVSRPSTGFALLEEGLEGRLETRPSTGYAYLEELIDEVEYPGKDTAKTQEHPKSKVQEDPSFRFNSRPQFPHFPWSVGKLDTGDLTTPLLKVEPGEETFMSVLKPCPGTVDEPKSETWLSVLKVPKPSGIIAPLLPATSGYVEEIEEVKRPSVQPQIQTEAVLDVLPGDLGGTSVGTTPETAVALLPTKKKKEADEWDILKSIVFGGLDISVASLAVTSSAAGGNAITRTVVYMGLATLLSGLIGFYHNVLNLYHYHRDHYTQVVGISLMLHGTVALISYVVFGLLSPLLYAFSYRETDDRDDKFILCCGVTIVAVTVLSLGKARVSNKRYLRTLFAYLSGGVLAAIVGYLTGEHVAELLEEWGI